MSASHVARSSPSQPVDRPRLTTLFDFGGPPFIAFIHAPAGSGKTTLLNQWATALGARGYGIVWHTVSDNVHDPLSLGDHLLHAIEGFVGADARKGPCPASETTARLLAAGTTLGHGQRLLVVVDDFHLAKQPMANEAIAALLRVASAHLLIAVAGRSLPQIAVGRLRAGGQLIEIGGADLRFDPAETDEFFRAVGGQALSEEESRLVEDRLEGWAAGLRLIALRLGRVPNRRLVFAAATAGEQKDVAEYFLEEVIADLDPADLAFIMRCCILETMPAALCGELTGRSDAETVLERLERENLFTSAMPGRRGWFRFHHLFLDFLRARLLSEPPPETANLHRCAAQWFVTALEPQEAVRHAFLAEDPDWAAELIERYCVFDYLSYGRFDLYQRWMRQLPASVRVERPLLSFLLVWRSINTRRFAQAEKLLRDIETQLLDPDGPAALIALRSGLRLEGRLHLMRALIGAYGADFTAALRHIDAIGNTPLDDEAFGQVDLDSIHSYLAYHQGELDRAMRLTWKAHRRYEGLDCQWGMIHSRIIAALVETAAGRLGDTRQILEETFETARRAFSSRAYMVALPAGLLGALLYEQGDLKGAEPLLVLATRNQEFEGTFGLAERLTIPTLTLARLLDSTGRADEANTILARASRLAYQAEDLRLDFELAIERADRSFRQRRFRELSSDLASVDSLLDEARRCFPPATWTIWQKHGILQARRQAMEGRMTEAVAGLRVLAEAAERSGRRQDAALLDVLAEAWSCQDDVLESEARLMEAIAKARGLGLSRSLHDLGDARVVSHLCAQTVPTPVPVRKSAPAGETAHALTRREQVVLSHLTAGLSNSEIGQALGIEVQTVKTHLKSVFGKIGVRSRAQAIAQSRVSHEDASAEPSKSMR